jgi:hypothetical protein
MTGDFELGFWHPFGSHDSGSPEDIINRKRSETEKNGWSLWSFQYRRPESLNEWYRELALAKLRRPVVKSNIRKARIVLHSALAAIKATEHWLSWLSSSTSTRTDRRRHIGFRLPKRKHEAVRRTLQPRSAEAFASCCRYSLLG